MGDPLASNMISTILTWIIAIPLVIGSIAGVTAFFEEPPPHHDGYPRRWLSVFGVYYMVCLIIISPLRYLILQVLLAESYFVQSVGAAMNGAIAATYGVILLSLAVGGTVVLPHILLLTSLKHEKKAMPIRTAILVPFTFATSYGVFFLLLPLAGWTFHWLGAKDVVRSANGPASIFYKLVVEPDIPRIGPKLETEDGDTANERLRAHMGQIYVSDFKRTKLHFSNSLHYLRSIDEVASQRHGVSVSEIPHEELASIVLAYQAALSQAEKVDTRILDARFPKLGTMFEEKYIPGLKALLSILEGRGHTALNPDQVKLQQWAYWYNARVNEIWDAL